MSDLLKEYSDEFKQIKKIASDLAKKPDFVQGNNASISIKLDEQYMVISAHDAYMKDITDKRNIVLLDYDKLSDWFLNTDPLKIRDGVEQNYNEQLKDSIIEDQIVKTAIPSDLAGVHSLLGKYVLHCNNVYANILNCTEQGIGIITRIFLEADYDWLWLPYNKQASKIAFMVKAAVEQHYDRREAEPQVLFLQNNGIIIQADTWEECVQIHDDIIQKIQKRLRFDEEYPEIKISGEKKKFCSESEYLKNIIFSEEFQPEIFMDPILFSQLNQDKWHKIFFTGADLDAKIQKLDNLDNFNFDNKDIVIDSDAKTITYHMSEKEALSMEQLLTQIVFIIERSAKSRLSLQPIRCTAPDFVGR